MCVLYTWLLKKAIITRKIVSMVSFMLFFLTLSLSVYAAKHDRLFRVWLYVHWIISIQVTSLSNVWRRRRKKNFRVDFLVCQRQIVFFFNILASRFYVSNTRSFLPFYNDDDDDDDGDGDNDHKRKAITSFDHVLFDTHTHTNVDSYKSAICLYCFGF